MRNVNFFFVDGGIMVNANQLNFTPLFQSLMCSRMILAALSGVCCRPRHSTKSPSGSARTVSLLSPRLLISFPPPTPSSKVHKDR